mmetsp:Transcript_11070/g.24673  ORF Transcript_11070/g.24673 Transcript_11070/m.24673 type:complete len:92 (+) Transcript_11070:59-334(+)
MFHAAYAHHNNNELLFCVWRISRMTQGSESATAREEALFLDSVAERFSFSLLRKADLSSVEGNRGSFLSRTIGGILAFLGGRGAAQMRTAK